MVVAAFALGAILGSFAGVVAHRVPEGRSLGGRSYCACGRKLSWSENIPLLGYLLAGGISRCCSTPIGWWAFGMELTYASASAAAMLFAGWPGVAAAMPTMLLTVWITASARKEDGP